ncbi:MAG TPA: response regulator transcription factor [Ignavibacteriaceae bacterium]|nr:response regulator transcription factor [Ignavibacteriaceae bacterium]
MIRIGIIEDDEHIREGIQKYLNAQNNFICEIAENSFENFLPKLDKEGPIDIALADIGLPGMSGINGIKILRKEYPDINIIMLTVYNDSTRIFNSLCAGASGYLLKNTPLEEIKKSIEILDSGGSPMSPEIARKVVEYFNPVKSDGYKSGLTQKENEIVNALVDGLSYKLVADRMNISIDTVRFHIRNIYRKLHVNSKAEVISKSLKGEI